MPEAIRVVVVGYGRSGRDIHVAALQELTDLYEVVGVVDTWDARRGMASDEVGRATYSDISEIPSGAADLVVNATPSHLHVATVLALLEQGFDVLADKPFARSLRSADLMIRRAEETGRRLAVFQQSRFAPYFVQTRAVIDSGVLGDLVQLSFENSAFARRWDFQTVSDMNGGNLLNTGPHPLDQALTLMGGDDVPQVFATMARANTSGDAEDYAKLVLRRPGSPLVDIEISSANPYPGPLIAVQGTNGGLTAHRDRVEWTYVGERVPATRPLVTRPWTMPDLTPAYCRENLEWHADAWELDAAAVPDPFQFMAVEYYRMLARHLAGEGPLEVTLDEVRRQIAVIEAAHRDALWLDPRGPA